MHSPLPHPSRQPADLNRHDIVLASPKRLNSRTQDFFIHCLVPFVICGSKNYDFCNYPCASHKLIVNGKGLLMRQKFRPIQCHSRLIFCECTLTLECAPMYLARSTSGPLQLLTMRVQVSCFLHDLSMKRLVQLVSRA